MPEDDRKPPPQPAQDEFLRRFHAAASLTVKNAYSADNRLLHHSPGRGITTNLAEDLMYISGVQMGVAEDFLASLAAGRVEAEAAGTVAPPPSVDDGKGGYSSAGADREDLRSEACFGMLHALYCRQVQFRDSLLFDLEGCCAAANDFYTLMEKAEEWAEDLESRHPHLLLVGRRADCGEGPPPHKEMQDLLRLYAADATYAARIVQQFVFESVWGSTIATELFGTGWEEGEAVVESLILTIDDYLADVEDYLGDNHLLLQKVLEALIEATVIFYVQCLLQKVDGLLKRIGTVKGKLTMSRNGLYNRLFTDMARATSRMEDDIYAMKSSFKSWMIQCPALDHTIEREFAMLVAMKTCLSFVGHHCRANMFVPTFYDRTAGNIVMTRKLIYNLLRSCGCQNIKDGALPPKIEDEIQDMVIMYDSHASTQQSTPLRNQIPDLSLRTLLLKYCDHNNMMFKDSVRPIHTSLPTQISRHKAVTVLKSDLRRARNNLHKLPLSKKKVKKKAVTFLRTCKQAAKI